MNWKLLIVTIVVFLFALGSGTYYYFSITNKESESSISNLNESKPIEITESEPEEIPVETSSFPAILTETETIEITTKQNLKQILADFTLKTEPGVTNGVFYEVSKSGEILTASQILQDLEINIPGINENSKRGWIYIESDGSENTRKALIVESSLSFVEIKNAIMPVEESLPSHLKNLYSPSLVLPDQEVLFRTSEVDKRFRYFNIWKGDPNKSTDWGIIYISRDGGESNLIMFSTSKMTTEKLVNSF